MKARPQGPPVGASNYGGCYARKCKIKWCCTTTSHKCCAAALCNNRSDNRKDLTFHAFPKDSQRRMEWAVKMKRSDSKFKSNTSLFYCSEHFVSTDYKRSLTGKRKDLLPAASP